MPKKGVGWPAVGQTSHDLDEHSNFLVDEARQLLEFGAPSDESGQGKQCPYHTLNAFCTSVIAYLEAPKAIKIAPDLKQTPTHGPLLETPMKTGSSKKLQHGSPFPSKVFRQISQPSTPQSSHVTTRTSVSTEKIPPLGIGTYGVLVLYVPSNFDVENQQRAINGIVSTNKGFIPGMSIKSIEWLIPEWTKTKHYSNLLVEFDHPEHANAAIREQLLIGTKVLGCEYYERDSRLRQCFFCQQYGHLEPQCQATKPACGRCAGKHITAECKAREDPQNFRCAVCRGTHRSWDNVCRVRVAELDKVRNARANAPKYHPVNGEVPVDDEMGAIPSREFAGTRRYSIDFLVEVHLRGGRKSLGRSKAKDGQQSTTPGKVMENATLPGPDTPSVVTTNDGVSGHEVPAIPQSAGSQFEAWLRSRLVALDIEPCLPMVPKPDQDMEDAEKEPPTPTPVRRSSGIWDRVGQSETPSKIPERTRKSLGIAPKPAEKSPSEKAASFAKIRNSDSWR